MADVERTPLLAQTGDRRLSKLVRQDEEASSIMKSHVTVDELKMSNTAIGGRLPYNDYTTIDWLHDLVWLELLQIQLQSSAPADKITR